MSASVDIRSRIAAQELGPAGLTRQIARPQPHLRCPTCKSILYARRHKLCGVCGEALPQTMLFSDAESFRIKSMLTKEQQRHRNWLVRAG
jgi:predicted nucleic acid-binding Zn ribbon protein